MTRIIRRFGSVDLPNCNIVSPDTTLDTPNYYVRGVIGSAYSPYASTTIPAQYPTRLTASGIFATRPTIGDAYSDLKGLARQTLYLYAQDDVTDQWFWCHATLTGLNAVGNDFSYKYLPIRMTFDRWSPWYSNFHGFSNDTSYTEHPPGYFSRISGTIDYTGTLTTTTISNGGQLTVENAVVQIDSTTGVTDGMRIYLGDYLDVPTTYGLLNIITLNCGAFSAVLNSTDILDDLTLPTIRNAWLPLAPGSNSVSLVPGWNGGNRTDGRVTFSFWEAFE